MEVAKQKTDRKTSYLSIYLFYYLFILFFFFFFFAFLHIVLLTVLDGLYYSVTVFVSGQNSLVVACSMRLSVQD